MQKVAVCGAWHVHAYGYIMAAVERGVEIVGIWDEDEKRKIEYSRMFKTKAFSSFDELLESDAEGVIVCSSTKSHADYMVKIANAGKHIFTEKVLAPTEEECARVEDAVLKNKVNFVISLITKYAPGQMAVKQIVDSGELGKINYVRYHNAHSGSTDGWLPEHFYNADECGGGAMIDLGAHGMYIIDWLCGVPVKCKSVFTTACTNESTLKMNKDRVEDNAVTVMEFADGCIAINETGFVSKNFPMSLEVGGENGSVILYEGKVIKRTTATEGKAVEVPLPEARPEPIVQFLTGNILEGCGIKEAKALTHLMVEAYKN